MRRGGRILRGDHDDVPVERGHAERGGRGRGDGGVVGAAVEQRLEERDAPGVLAALELQLGEPVRVGHRDGVAVDGLPDPARHVELDVPAVGLASGPGA